MKLSDCVIFAGGASKRMGQDKALLPFGGYPTLAEYQFERLKKLFDNVYISTKEPKFSFHAPMIYDKYTVSSPMVALYSALTRIDAPEIFIVSVDMPFVDKILFEKLWNSYQRDNVEIAIASSSRGAEPLCGIYSHDTADRVKSFLDQGEHRMQALLGVCNFVEVKCDREKVFANLNTPTDYKRHNGD